MLQISFLAKTFQSLCLRKRINYICILWITNRYNAIKSHTKDLQTGLIILILRLQKISPGCHARLFISRLTCNIFLFSYYICRLFPMFLPCFCSPRAFFYFPLRKATSCSKYSYCHSRKLEFRTIVLCFFEPINLLACLI